MKKNIYGAVAAVAGAAGAMLTVASPPASGVDLAYGEYIASSCFTCHRADGVDTGFPRITGRPAKEVLDLLTAYRDKIRPNEVMQAIATQLTGEEAHAVAHYLESLKSRLTKAD
ncbi:MAG: hypothetical protein NW205_09785 [Hyphomicrobiaceae bacterium]|nr:hypothetical protein [Hyphomicrobiaceae bacterium]